MSRLVFSYNYDRDEVLVMQDNGTDSKLNQVVNTPSGHGVAV